MEPTVELVRFPEGYGTPTVTLAWSDVQARLIAAEQWCSRSRQVLKHPLDFTGSRASASRWLDGALAAHDVEARTMTVPRRRAYGELDAEQRPGHQLTGPLHY